MSVAGPSLMGDNPQFAITLPIAAVLAIVTAWLRYGQRPIRDLPAYHEQNRAALDAIQAQLEKIDGNIAEVEKSTAVANGRLRTLEAKHDAQEKLSDERRHVTEKELTLLRDLQREDREASRREIDTFRVTIEATRGRISDLGDRLQVLVLQAREATRS